MGPQKGQTQGNTTIWTPKGANNRERGYGPKFGSEIGSKFEPEVRFRNGPKFGFEIGSRFEPEVRFRNGPKFGFEIGFRFEPEV